MYPFSIFLLAFAPLLLCTLHPCLQISRPVKCLCTKFVTNRRQHSVLHHLSKSACNIIPKDICKYCIHSSDFLLPEKRSGKLRWTKPSSTEKVQFLDNIKVKEGGRRAIMISTSNIMIIIKSALTLSGAERAYGQALGEEICKRAKMSNCKKIMMMIIISLGRRFWP